MLPIFYDVTQWW